jgi:hypothetical protein
MMRYTMSSVRISGDIDLPIAQKIDAHMNELAAQGWRMVGQQMRRRFGVGYTDGALEKPTELFCHTRCMRRA